MWLDSTRLETPVTRDLTRLEHWSQWLVTRLGLDPHDSWLDSGLVPSDSSTALFISKLVLHFGSGRFYHILCQISRSRNNFGSIGYTYMFIYWVGMKQQRSEILLYLSTRISSDLCLLHMQVHSAWRRILHYCGPVIVLNIIYGLSPRISCIAKITEFCSVPIIMILYYPQVPHIGS